MDLWQVGDVGRGRRYLGFTILEETRYYGGSKHGSRSELMSMFDDEKSVVMGNWEGRWKESNIKEFSHKLFIEPTRVSRLHVFVLLAFLSCFSCSYQKVGTAVREGKRGVDEGDGFSFSCRVRKIVDSL